MAVQTIENVQEIVNILMNKVVDLRFINTICFPTKRNQEQIKELSEKCDVMFVIGSFTSANSKRLTDLSKERNKRSYQVTCALDINEKWLEDCNVVGISAGASTPDNIIEEVLDRIKEIQKLLIDQVGILETMTPMDFLEFRDLLNPASGFQSVQFREIENKLGMPSSKRIKFGKQRYDEYLENKADAKRKYNE